MEVGLRADNKQIFVYPADCTDFSTTGLVGDLKPLKATFEEQKNGICEIEIKMPYDQLAKWKAVRNDCIIKCEVPVRVPPVIANDEYANSVDVYES